MNEISSRIASLSPEQLARLAYELKASKKNKVREIPKRVDGDSCALSFSQQRLWFLDQLDPGNAAYHVTSTLRLSGPLNVAGLKQAFTEIVRRHEVLRTTFAVAGGQPVQTVGPVFELPLPTIDLQDLNRTEQQAWTLKLASQHALAPFDLVRGPVLRTCLLRIHEREHVLLAAMHHIVSDGWSLGLLISEVAMLYEAFSRGESSALPELQLQYADFAQWQREWMAGARLEEKLNYWKQQLAETPILSLPTDRPRPSVQTFAGAKCSLVLSESLCSALKELSRQTGATLFMTMLAGFQALLHRYAQQARILTGAPVANRTPETEALIGFFINTLVLHADFADDPTFLTQLARLRQDALGAYANQDLPFELLVDKLQLPRDLSYNPLFQVMFNWDEAGWNELELAGLDVAIVDMDNPTSQFDLTLTVRESAGQLLCFMQYSTALFDEATIERMLGHYEELLRRVVREPQQRVSRLSLLAEEERQQLVREWNKTGVAYETGVTLVELFERQVERTGAAVAVVSGERQVTYRDLNECANRVARNLRKLGVGPEARVGLLVERGVEMVVGLLGIIKAGAAYVPLDPGYPRARLEYMLRDAALNIVLTERRLEQLATETAANVSTVLCVDEAWAEQESGANLNLTVDSENLAYVIYTSGSTGQPKGAMNTHRAICNRLFWMQDAYRLTVNDHVLQKTPFSFDVSVWEFFWPLLTGARLVMAEPNGHQNPSYLRRVIEQEQITVMHFVPAMLRVFLEEPGLERCTSLRQVFCSGEALSFDLQQQCFAKLSARLHNLYGPTEAAVDVTHWACQPDSVRKVVPIGKPIANTQIYLLDRNYEPVPVGVAGELYIGGVNLARGYHGQPGLTAEKFVPDPFSREPGARLYQTGDLARYLPDGAIEFLGRMDHQVKLHGLRIELGEIETALSEHVDVQAAVVVAREDEPRRQRLVAYILPSNKSVSIPELRGSLEQRLPDYMVPSAFLLLEEWPRLPNGKIDRASLPAPDRALRSPRVYVAPRNAVEETLAQIWQQVLGVKQVGIHDGFFELGGDSILSIQIVARANQAGLKLAPKLIFRHQTIAELSQVVVPWVASTAQQGLVTGQISLTPIQRHFFEQQFDEPQHFNQSVLLIVKRPPKAERLQRVVEQLMLHHDALRLRFKRDDVSGEWQQFYAGVEAAQQVRVEEIDLGDVDELEIRATELQRGLNLEAGPLLRVALIAMPGNSGQRLLLVIHHLVVDGVSWQILLDDLQRGIEQDERGEQVSLGPKTTSYGEWSERLATYEVHEELGFWTEVVREAARVPLPLDHEGTDRTIASSRSIVQQLDPEETRVLLQEVPAAYHTQINDALLTALAEVIAKWSGKNRVAVELEGHGREEIAQELDLSRTVGWFTSVYPVVLEVAGTATPGEALQQVKEQLRRIPGSGIGYGVLRYLSESEIGEQLESAPVELSFNYLGQLDQVLTTQSLFTGASEPTGAEQSERGRQRYALDVTAAVVQGKLRVRFTYNERLHTAATIEEVSNGYIAALRALITHCQSPEAGGFTPSDFPLIGLNQADLDLALSEVE